MTLSTRNTPAFRSPTCPLSDLTRVHALQEAAVLKEELRARRRRLQAALEDGTSSDSNSTHERTRAV